MNRICPAVQGPTTALSEPYLNDITMFDVNTHTWHTPDVQGARPPVRDSHAAVALGDRMVIYGGDCGKEYLGDVWAYHVEHQKWQAFKVRAAAANAGCQSLLRIVYSNCRRTIHIKYSVMLLTLTACACGHTKPTSPPLPRLPLPRSFYDAKESLPAPSTVLLSPHLSFALLMC